MQQPKFSLLANRFSKALISWIVFMLVYSSLFAQQKYPATVNVNILPPYSVYLADYIGKTSNKLTATVVFNDFNEPSWNIYLKVKIESPNLRISTKANFIPLKPITVIPGVPFNITGEDLAPYFDFENIDVAGITKSELISSGKLLEGNYSFCFEVYDYKSGKLMSNNSCSAANIRLFQAPRLVSPSNETVFPISTPQNINFQWQLTEAQNIVIQYKLHLYELPDEKIDPDVAISNNSAIKIFESKIVFSTNFLYDLSSPLLQRGKKYAWRIQAIQEGNRNEFKNDGYSLAGYFYYGYPEKGSITIIQPVDQYSFSLRDEKIFRWNAPNNLTKNQPYYYNYILAPILPNQTDSDAIIKNAPLFTQQSAELIQTYGYDILVNKKFESNTSYAWQVTAHTGEQIIASSPVTKFYGPPILESFYAGNHIVYISKAKGTLSDLSGEGEVVATSTGVTQKVYFNHIEIGKSGVLYVLSKGTVTGKYNLPSIVLTPEYEPNGTAYYMADSIILNTSGLFLKGYVKWSFPHPTITPNPAFITSKLGTIDYNEFRLLGVISLSDSLKYELADPFGFSVEFISGSDLVLRGRNNYFPRLNGMVRMPQTVKDIRAKFIKLPFVNAHKLDIITETNVLNAPSVDLLDNSRLYLQPVTYSFDFSETESIDKFSDDKEWKGVYITRSNFIFDSYPDKNNQLIYKKTVSNIIDASDNGADSCWFTSLGLQFHSTRLLQLSDSVWFNKFPSFITNYHININNSVLSASYLKGKLKIPLISETRDFIYTVPLSEKGFQFGYLDESLDGINFVYNEIGGEQKINIKINKAVFADKERLDMNIDLAWPSLELSLSNLEGFKVWGNTQIGFLKPNGMFSLPYQINGKLRGFPITTNDVGAGSAPGLYVFAFKADVIMTADVTGPEGPPVVNLYSIYNNKLLGDYSLFNETLETSATVADNQANTTSGLLEDIPAEGVDLTKLEEQIDEQLNFSEADIVENAKLMLESTSLSSDSSSVATTATASSDSLLLSKTNSLSSQQQQMLKDKAQIAVKILIARYAGSLNDIGKEIADKIDKVTLDINSSASNFVYSVVDSMTTQILKNISDATIKQALQEVASVTKNEIVGKITSNITSFSKELKDDLNPANALALVVSSAVEEVLQDVIEKGLDDISINELLDKAGGSLSESGKLLGQIPQKLAAKGTELLRNLSPQEVLDNLTNSLKNVAYAKAKQLIEDKVADVVSSYIGEDALADVTKFVDCFKIDMDNAGKKFKSAAVKEIFSDPVSISLQTQIVSLAGYIQYTPDDPEYGNVWKGDITASLKVPVKFGFNVSYLVGKKDGLNYWFCQVRPPSKSGTTNGSNGSKSTAVSEKKAYPLENPVPMGPVELVGISGRLYTHMKDDGKTIVPDAGTDYGAYLNVVLFDTDQDGKTLYLNVATEYIVTSDKEFVFDLYGKCMVRPSDPSMEGNDCDAVAIGVVHFNYNSSKHHLIGSGSLEINKTGIICAHGSFALDVQPGKWYVALGNRDDRIIFVPGCAGWSPTGWLIVDQNTAELGLGLQYSLKAGINFDIGIVALGVRVDAGVAAGIMVKIQYNPDFKLMDAGIWAEIWAKVFIDYKINLFLAKIRGSITLIDLYATANLTMHFYPPPKLFSGDVKGYLKLCGIVSCNFNASFKEAM